MTTDIHICALSLSLTLTHTYTHIHMHTRRVRASDSEHIGRVCSSRTRHLHACITIDLSVVVFFPSHTYISIRSKLDFGYCVYAIWASSNRNSSIANGEKKLGKQNVRFMRNTSFVYDMSSHSKPVERINCNFCTKGLNILSKCR